MSRRGLGADRPATLVEIASTNRAVARWLDELPSRIDRCIERFDLRLVGPMFTSGHASWTAPGVSDEGRGVVVKIQWPHRECEHEALALRIWNGDGAALLLDHEPAEHALLLERLDPGEPLSSASTAHALDVLVDLVHRLAVIPPDTVGTLAEEAVRWRRSMERAWRTSPEYEARLHDAALEFLDGLVDTQPEQVVVHQDLHGANVLSARRAPWLAIDPKPLAAERAFAIAPIVRSAELGHSAAAVLGRFDRLVDDLALDHERAKGWAVVQTLAWSCAGGWPWHAQMHEVARWLLDHR